MKFVICEGNDDVSVVKGLAESLGLTIEVEHCAGKDNLSNYLHAFRKRSDFVQQKIKSIAILRDADLDAAAAFTSVCAALEQNSLDVPPAVGVLTQSALRVGVFVVEVDGQGMIEDLCLKSVSDRPEFSCVDTYFKCITEKSARANFSSKRKVRVWLASHVDFDYRLGKAAEAGYWPWGNPAFDSLKSFLMAL